MLKALKVIGEFGATLQWVVFIYIASTVALSAASPYLHDRSTTIALIASMVVGACVEIWAIDKEFQKPAH